MASITNPVGICNLALGLIRQDNISSLNGNNATSVVCDKWYDQTREQVLMMHTWNFAIRRINIAEDAETPAYGWSHRYLLPTDYLRFLSIGDNDSGTLSRFTSDKLIDNSRRVDYELEHGYILVNEEFTEGLNLRYIANVSEVGLMPALFKNALATQLALNMTFEFKSNTTSVQRLASEMQLYLQQAMSVDGQERPPRRIERSKWNRTRRIGGSGYTTDRLGCDW